MKLFRYFLFRVYSFYLKKNESPIYDTLLFISLTFAINIITAFVFISNFVTVFKNVFTSEYSIYFFGAFAILFLLFNFLVLGSKKKWTALLNEFSNETISQKKKGGIFVVLYVILSSVLFFISLAVTF